MGTIRRLVALAVIGGGALLAVPAVAGADVLYDQTDNAATPNANIVLPNYSPSNFYSVGDYSRPADDFTVPLGATWSINEVDVTGAYNANPGSVVNVYIYPDANGQPGTAAFTQEGITATGGPNYHVPLTGVPNLTAGRYWITVQQDASGGGGFWSWGTRSVQSGTAAQWFRPQYGPGPSCGTGAWFPRFACWPPGNPDQTFALKGTNLTPQPDVAPILSAASLSRKTFAVGGASVAAIPKRKQAPRGTRIRTTVSEVSKLTFTVERRLGGRRVGRSCLPATKKRQRRPRCARYVRKGAFTTMVQAGANSTPWSGHLRKGKRLVALRPGWYRLRVQAIDSAGQPSAERRLVFRIVKR